jgi:hypothetical protein
MFSAFLFVNTAWAQEEGDTLHGGIVVDVGLEEKHLIVVRTSGGRTRYSWNDAQNDIELHRDSTKQQWRLPSMKELEEFYHKKKILTNIEGSVYWSSEVDDSYDAQATRSSREDSFYSGRSEDGNLMDLRSQSDEYVRTLNFFSGVLEWHRKIELFLYLSVLDLPASK